MRISTSYLFIILASIILSTLQCDGSKNLEKIKFSTTQLISINNSYSISLITNIPKSKTALFLMGTTNRELENQPSMDYVDYYTDHEQSACINLSASLYIFC